MVVLVLEQGGRPLRGTVSRWMLEISSGVFVGNLSAIVRQKVWDMVRLFPARKGAIVVYPAATEQGLCIETIGQLKNDVVSVDDIFLMGKLMRDT